MAKKVKKKKKLGRPTKYKPEYCKGIVDFFSDDPYRERAITHTCKKGDEWTTYEDVANDIPFLSDFAYKIGVNQDTLHEWKKKHLSFSEALIRAKELQKQFLITNGLKGLYPTGSYCFTAKNITDMRDKTEIDHNISLKEVSAEFKKLFTPKDL